MRIQARIKKLEKKLKPGREEEPAPIIWPICNGKNLPLTLFGSWRPNKNWHGVLFFDSEEQKAEFTKRYGDMWEERELEE